MELSNLIITRPNEIGKHISDHLTTYNPENEFLFKVIEYSEVEPKKTWGLKAPLNTDLNALNEAIQDFFSPDGEHYSVVIVACKDDLNTLRKLCAALGA